MQQFTVPQFIDVEDKILGPITGRQFVILFAGLILSAIAYKLCDFSLFIFLAVVIYGTCGAFAFLKINGRLFHFFIVDIAKSFLRPRLRVWNNQTDKTGADDRPAEIKTEKKEDTRVDAAKRIYSSRLSELSLVVDTRGVYRGGKRSGPRGVRRPIVEKIIL